MTAVRHSVFGKEQLLALMTGRARSTRAAPKRSLRPRRGDAGKGK